MAKIDWSRKICIEHITQLKDPFEEAQRSELKSAPASLARFREIAGKLKANRDNQ